MKFFESEIEGNLVASHFRSFGYEAEYTTTKYSDRLYVGRKNRFVNVGFDPFRGLFVSTTGTIIEGYDQVIQMEKETKESIVLYERILESLDKEED